MSAAIPKPEKVTVAGIEVDVWHLDLDALNEDRAAETILSQDEVHRAQQFREERDRARWTSGRVALRRILSGYCETEPGRVRFAYNEVGKPALAEGGPDALPSFNMSRAGQFALCAVARCGALGAPTCNAYPTRLRMRAWRETIALLRSSVCSSKSQPRSGNQPCASYGPIKMRTSSPRHGFQH